MFGNPLARTEDLVVQETANERLIYDLKINKAYSLNETSTLVWQLCDGKNSVSEIAGKISSQLGNIVSEKLVWLALDQFSKDGLLENDELVVKYSSGHSRRELIRKVGLTSLIVLPVVSSIVAPRATNAQSTFVQICTTVNCQCPVSNPTSCDTLLTCTATSPQTFIGGVEVGLCT